MIKLLGFCVFVFTLLTGCYNKPQSVESVGTVEVEKMFSIDGCTVYRFDDGMRAVYFTNCSGATRYSESCGKNCSRQVGVD